MKISTRGRYGLRAMVDIAAESGDRCVTVKSISQRQGISEHYLEQLIAPLKKAGYLKSIRGAQGGYVLDTPAEQLSVGDILRVLEGSLKVTDCGTGADESGCSSDSCKKCVTKTVWTKMYESILEVVDTIMLSDLVEEYKEISETDECLLSE